MIGPSRFMASLGVTTLALVALSAPVDAETPRLSNAGAAVAVGVTDPFFDDQDLHARPSIPPGPLENVERPGPAVWDRESRAWFASANGKLVRIEGTSLVVVADGIQGRDLDVRFARCAAVSREPDDRIVLHIWDGEGTTHTMLVEGEGYFGPRFSPDGESILLSESRAAGGRMIVVSSAGEKRDLGQGYGPVWHPDGKHVVFSRIEHDGHRVTAADLYVLNLATGTEYLLPGLDGAAEVEPAVSADGQSLAFVDALTGEVHLGPFPAVSDWQEVGR